MRKGFPSRNSGKGEVKDTRPAGGNTLNRKSEGLITLGAATAEEEKFTGKRLKD